MLAAGRPLFLIPPETPEEAEIRGDWQQVGKATWLVPGNLHVDSPAVQQWLFVLGNWTLYRAAEPAEIAPGCFRCRADEQLAWMMAHSVEAMIDAFHDNSDWVVAYVEV